MIASQPPRRLIATAAFFALLAILPAFAEGYVLTVMILVLQYAYFGQAWNIMTGFSGQLSLGHSLFVGLGAYTAGVLVASYGESAWLGVGAATVVGAVAGTVVGYLAFRFALRGIYFAMLTLAVAEFFIVFFANWGFVGGSSGLFLPAIPADNTPLLTLRGGPLLYYYIFLFLTVAAFLASAWLLRSRVGYFWRAIGSDEDAARAVGVPAFRLKVLAAAISGGMTGLGGAFYVLFAGNLFPETSFSLSLSIAILVGPVIGGMGTLFGPILGSLVIVPLGELTTSIAEALGLNGLGLVVYGTVVLVIVLFLPTGIWPPLAAKLGIGRSAAARPKISGLRPAAQAETGR